MGTRFYLDTYFYVNKNSLSIKQLFRLTMWAWNCTRQKKKKNQNQIEYSNETFWSIEQWITAYKITSFLHQTVIGAFNRIGRQTKQSLISRESVGASLSRWWWCQFFNPPCQWLGWPLIALQNFAKWKNMDLITFFLFIIPIEKRANFVNI